MVGGGTSVEVAHEMVIEAHGLDLHSSFNIIKERIIDVVKQPSDLVLRIRPITTSSSTAAMCGEGGRIPTICRAARARVNFSTS